MEVEVLLRKWGVPAAIIERFVEQEVTPSSILFLSLDTLGSYFPTDGPRAQFLHHLEVYKKSKAVSDSNNNVESELEDDADDVDNQGPPAKRNCSGVESLSQILRSEPDINDIHKVLKQDIPGLIVLAQYRNFGVLDDYSRDLLAQEIIRSELRDDHEKSLERHHFDNFADQVVELFETEDKATWFDCNRKNGELVVHGRLRLKYYSVRRAMINTKLIPKKTRRTREIRQEETNVDPAGFLAKVTDEDFLWLTKSKEPWALVAEKWEGTYELRMEFRTHCLQNTDYLDAFPASKEDLFWELVARDGIKEHPVLALSTDLWKDYSTKLIDLIRLDRPKFRLRAKASDDEKFVSLIQEVPKLFKVKTIAKSSRAPKRSNCMRPSQLEIEKSFCIHAQTISEVVEVLADRKVLLEKYKFPNQPVPVFVGPKDNLHQCFIAFEDFRWEVEGPIQAFFGAFSIYFGLDSEYPAESKHLWVFLQQTLLNIDATAEFKKDRGLKSCLAARLKHFNIVSSK